MNESEQRRTGEQCAASTISAVRPQRAEPPLDVRRHADARLRTDAAIARELVATVRENATIDWTVRENVRAQLRVLVKRSLRKHGYPPDKQESATQTVLQQADLFSEEWAPWQNASTGNGQETSSLSTPNPSPCPTCPPGCAPSTCV